LEAVEAERRRKEAAEGEEDGGNAGWDNTFGGRGAGGEAVAAEAACGSGGGGEEVAAAAALWADGGAVRRGRTITVVACTAMAASRSAGSEKTTSERRALRVFLIAQVMANCVQKKKCWLRVRRVTTMAQQGMNTMRAET